MAQSQLKEGEVRTIIADAPLLGFQFDQWTGDVASLTDPMASTTIVTMPAGNVTVSANYSEIIFTPINYGALYNWYAASMANFAPAGWHVPTYPEWEALISYLGGISIAGGKLKETGTTYWNTPNTGATNEVLFNWRGAGWRAGTGGFDFLRERGYCWSTTFAFDDLYKFVQANYNSAGIIGLGFGSNPKIGMSVRLIKNDSTDPGSLTDIEGNVYPTVKIGSQVWLAANWTCTKLNDGTPIANITDNSAWAALTTGAYCWYDNDINNG